MYNNASVDCISHGLDHYGGDIKCVKALSYEECAIRCSENIQCRRWSFNMGDTFRKCYLKREKSLHEIDSCRFNCISGLKNSSAEICGRNGKKIISVISFLNNYKICSKLNT